MSNEKKRLLESPEENIGIPKVSKVFITKSKQTTCTNNPGSMSYSLGTTDKVAVASTITPSALNKDDIVSSIRTAIADEFKIFKTDHIAPIVKDVSAIKEDIQRMQTDRDGDRDRINFLERELKKRNIIFTKIPKMDNIEKAIIDLCTGTLRINEVYIDKVVVLRTNNDNTLTALVVFSSQKTTDQIIRNSKKLKGTGIGVSRDLGLDDREARNRLLYLRKLIKEKDTSQIVKVYGNQIIINDLKLSFTRNNFGNKNINGKQYILEKFGIDFDEINKQ